MINLATTLNLFKSRILNIESSGRLHLRPVGKSRLEPINVRGNKLITSTYGGGGVDFFTKLLLDKAYADARILYLDAGGTFSRVDVPWTRPVHRYRIAGELYQGYPHDKEMELPQWNVQTDVERLIPGLSVIDLVPNWEWRDTHATMFIDTLIRQFTQLPRQAGKPCVLVLDHCWQHLLFTETPTGTLIRDVLRVTRGNNQEIWLVDDGHFYMGAERNVPESLVELIAGIDQLCLLRHPFVYQHHINTYLSLYGLNGEGMNLLKSLDPHRQEVFIKSGSKTSLYQMVTTEEEKAIYKA